MTVSVRPLLFKPHRLNGLSDRLLISHYENNYGGALRRLNAIEARIDALDWSAAPVFDINGLKREELIAAGSVILHEIYFDALGGDGGDPPGGNDLAKALERDFGSVAAWTIEFTAIAKAQAGGSGWRLGQGSKSLRSTTRALHHELRGGTPRHTPPERAARPIEDQQLFILVAVVGAKAQFDDHAKRAAGRPHLCQEQIPKIERQSSG
jgi:hypothetical protein